MGYLILAVELAASIALYALFAVMSAFQTEALRSGRDHPLSLVLTVAWLAVLFGPLLYSGYRFFKDQHPLGLGWFLLILAAAGVLAFGLMVLNEKVVRSIQRSRLDAKVATFYAPAKAGDGAAACALVQLAPQYADEVFPFCKAHLTGLPKEKLWEELKKFTSGYSILVRADASASNGLRTVIPAAHQQWFLGTFFTAYLDPACRSDQTSDEFLLGLVLHLASLPSENWEPRALRYFVGVTLPTLDAHIQQSLQRSEAAGATELLQKIAPFYPSSLEKLRSLTRP